MKSKKLIVTIILIITVLLSQFSFFIFNSSVHAVTSNADGYHYKQIVSDNNVEAQKIYQALSYMYENGILKTGVQRYDLVANGYLTNNDIEDYLQGNSNLMTDFYTARYAFYADHPEIFYADFSKIAMRTTKSNDGKYHAYIGSGNNADYYASGITKDNIEKAITDFDTRVNEIVTEAKNLKDGENTPKDKIRYVHDQIIYNTSYIANVDFSSTPYGTFVKKQAICEGYARAFKTVMDKLGIQCILVQGVHANSIDNMVEHMWNYVQINVNGENRWYAVDCALDDPYDKATLEKQGVDGFENSTYLLVGSDTMEQKHVAIENIDAAGGAHFDYPSLYKEDFGTEEVANIGGLTVQLIKEGGEIKDDADSTGTGKGSGVFRISYLGMGINEWEKAGYCLMVKYYKYNNSTNEVEYIVPEKPNPSLGIDYPDNPGWQYFGKEMFAIYTKDTEFFDMPAPHYEYVSFAITDILPESNKDYYYDGDESHVLVQTDVLHNENGTYMSAPIAKYMSPTNTAKLSPEGKKHIVIKFGEDLKLINDAKVPNIVLESTGPTALEYTKIENVKFDGKNTITFDCTFSQMWADDWIDYTFYFKDIVGVESGKQPQAVGYYVGRKLWCVKCMAKSGDWRTWAVPKLMENSDLSKNDWTLANGQKINGSNTDLYSRMSLVTTRTSSEQEIAMKDLLKSEDSLKGKQYEVSQTYNISFNICRANVIKTGNKVRVYLGFPAGYGPEDEGVTYKVYHYKLQNGQIVGTEELECVVTQYGLLIVCDSFSPFAIVTVKGDDSSNQTKSVLVNGDSNGKIILDESSQETGIMKLSNGQTKAVTVDANDGYQIEKITVAGKEINITNKEQMTVNVSYNDITNLNNIVSATFVAKAVAEKEQGKEEVIVPELEPAQITQVPERIEAELGESISIEPNIINGSGIDTYQWYKDDVALEGQTASSLNIENMKKSDAGKYHLVITSKSVSSSTSKEIVSSHVSIVCKETEEIITSQDYVIDEDSIISNVDSKTTVAVFKQKVEASEEMVFTDINGKALEESDIITTGTKLNIGNKAQYTLSVLGDLDKNGTITTQDAIKVLRYTIGLETLSKEQLKAGDVNSSGKIDTKDANNILRYTIGFKDF